MIYLYGATGFTGRLIARALLDRGLRDQLVLGGRNPGALAELAGELGGVATRAAELSDFEQVRDACAGARVVVTCAGPFSRLGEVVLRAALAAGAGYLDTTGEQAFMREMYERYDSPARRARVAAVSGFGFEVALGDWLAALAGAALGASTDDPVDEIAIGYGLEGFVPTRGTRLSALEAVQAPGVTWAGDRWQPATAAAEQRTIGFPSPIGARRALSFPSGEVVTVPRHVAAHRVQTFLAARGLPGGAVARWLAPALPALLRSPLGSAVRKRAAGGPPGPTDGQRAVTDYAIVAEARRGFATAHAAAVGVDVYGTTADLVAIGVQALLAGAPACGVLAPSQLVAPEYGLTELSRRRSLHLHKSFA